MKQKDNKKLAREWFYIGEEEFKFAKTSFKNWTLFILKFVFNASKRRRNF